MTVFLDKNRGVWKFDFQRAGLRHVGDCLHADGRRAANRSEAKRIEEGHKAAANNRPEARIGTPMGYSMAQACLAYLGTMAGRRSEPDARRHVQELLDSKQFPAARLVTDITDQDVLDFIAAARARPKRVWIAGPLSRQAAADQIAPEAQEKAAAAARSNASINRLLGTLRAVLSLAHRMRDPHHPKRRLLPDMPLIAPLRELQRDPRPVPDEVLERIAEHAEQHLVEALWLMRLTGMRADEALTARASRCDFDMAIYWLPAEATKGGRDEPMPIDEAALPMLRHLADKARQAGRDELILYTPPAPKDCQPGEEPKPRPVKSLRKAWAAAQRRAGIARPYRIHDIRASFITAVATVAPDRVLQSLARHISPATTARYVKIVDPLRRAAVQAAPKPNLKGIGSNPSISSPTPVSHFSGSANQEASIKVLKIKR